MTALPRLISIVGARPQFIKLAPLVPVLNKWSEHRIVHTGQHSDYRMSSIFLRQLTLPRTDKNLKISGGGHGAMTGRMLIALEKYLTAQRPSIVLVYGDTNSTLAGVLAATKLGIPVAHIEAGLRSHLLEMPEEINRRVADLLAHLCFCPTQAAIRNLKAEGISEGVVHSGDVMYEQLMTWLPQIRAARRQLSRYDVRPQRYLYFTVHRAAAVDDIASLRQVLKLLASLEEPVIFPVHPRTGARLRRFNLDRKLRQLAHVTIIPPQGYLDNLVLAANARYVLTDSGGLQKEALFLGTPVLTLRNETEWIETLRMGNRLVGLDVDKVMRAMRKKVSVEKPKVRVNGRRPSQIISSAIRQFLRGK